MRSIVQTDQAPAAIGPYSQAVVHNGIAYLSGQIAIDPETGDVVDGDAAAQAERVLQNLKGVLEACGSSMAKVLKTTVYLKNLDDYAKVNVAYGWFFPENPPARAAVEVARLPRDVLVEIDCVASIDD